MGPRVPAMSVGQTTRQHRSRSQLQLPRKASSILVRDSQTPTGPTGEEMSINSLWRDPKGHSLFKMTRKKHCLPHLSSMYNLCWLVRNTFIGMFLHCNYNIFSSFYTSRKTLLLLNYEAAWPWQLSIGLVVAWITVRHCAGGHRFPQPSLAYIPYCWFHRKSWTTISH